MKREGNTITNRGKHMSYGVGSYTYMLVFNVVVITTSLFLFLFLVNCILCLCMTLVQLFEIYRFILISYWEIKTENARFHALIQIDLRCFDQNTLSFKNSFNYKERFYWKV